MMVLFILYFCSKSQVALLAYGSIPDVGSSKNTVSEPPINAIAQLNKNCEYRELQTDQKIKITSEELLCKCCIQSFWLLILKKIFKLLQ